MVATAAASQTLVFGRTGYRNVGHTLREWMLFFLAENLIQDNPLSL